MVDAIRKINRTVVRAEGNGLRRTVVTAVRSAAPAAAEFQRGCVEVRIAKGFRTRAVDRDFAGRSVAPAAPVTDCAPFAVMFRRTAAACAGNGCKG